MQGGAFGLLSAKIVQTSGMAKKKHLFFRLPFPSAALSYRKIVQTSGMAKKKHLFFRLPFPSAALSYRKIVQTSGMGKKNGSLENVCGRSFEGLLRTSCSCAPSGHFSCGRTHHPRSALLSSPDRGYPCFSPPQGLPLLHASHSRSALCVAGNACRKGGDYSQSLGESLCRNMKNIFAGSP